MHAFILPEERESYHLAQDPGVLVVIVIVKRLRKTR